MEVPKYILMPTIIILSVVGAYTINNSIMDIYWMIGFGILGYLMKLYKIPVAPVILGVILSSLIEQNFRRSVSMVGNSFPLFVKDLFTHPISIVLTLAILIMLFGQTSLWKKWKAKRQDNK